MGELLRENFHVRILYGVHLVPGSEGKDFPEVTVSRGTASAEITGPTMDAGTSLEEDLDLEDDLVVLVLKVREVGP
jgi:hypothetical protein